LEALAALHQSKTPPGELLLPLPRKLRWRKSLKVIVGFDAVLLMFGICPAIWFCILETRFYRDTVSDIRRWNEKTRQLAAQTNDTEQKAEAEKFIRENDNLERKWRTLYVVMLAIICMTTLIFPAAHVGATWFVHVWPNLLLLREGAPVRADVIQRKRSLMFIPRLEFGFTTDRGKHIRRTQPVAWREAPLFNTGDSVWALYLPRRPKPATIYALKSAMAEIVAG
jgi:hypothetical protein